MHARLDCGADANFMSEEKALILGHKLERYNGPDFNMGIGQLQPIYQIYVTWTSIYRIKEVLKASTTVF